jgi:hypothetical protein
MCLWGVQSLQNLAIVPVHRLGKVTYIAQVKDTLAKHCSLYKYRARSPSIYIYIGALKAANPTATGVDGVAT